jgi:diguanylate cyclase (GGDEF)-like protein
MAASDSDDGSMRSAEAPWTALDAAGRGAMLTEILAQVSREALQGEGLDDVMQRIVDCLIRRLPIAIASIIVLAEDGEYFVQEVWAGELNLAQPTQMPWPISLGAAGRCARTGQAQLIADVAHDRDYVPGNDSVRAEYIVPIRHRDRLHGVLNIESTRADFFSAETCAAFDAIANQIAGAVHLARIVAELEIANRKLQQLSMIDGLTGIANRRCFDQRLAAAWALLAREGGSLALILVDADCFKALNDVRGHLYGDECLCAIARICTSFAERESDLAARFGGEELMLLLPCCEFDDALRIGENLRAKIEAAAMDHPDSTVGSCVTVSVGVSVMRPNRDRVPAQLIEAADRALYAAKAAGRNRVEGCGLAESD